MTPETIRSIAVLTGAALISAGAGLIYAPAGLIVGGVLLFAMGIAGHFRGANK